VSVSRWRTNMRWAGPLDRLYFTFTFLLDFWSRTPLPVGEYRHAVDEALAGLDRTTEILSEARRTPEPSAHPCVRLLVREGWPKLA